MAAILIKRGNLDTGAPRTERHVKMKGRDRGDGGFYKPRNAKTVDKAPEAQRKAQNISPPPALSVGSSPGDKNWMRVRGCIS